jgi:hypothetical protein
MGQGDPRGQHQGGLEATTVRYFIMLHSANPALPTFPSCSLPSRTRGSTLDSRLLSFGILVTFVLVFCPSYKRRERTRDLPIGGSIL